MKKEKNVNWNEMSNADLMITTIFLIALFTNWLTMLPVYQNTVTWLRLPSKPFRCEYCLAFWLSAILSIALHNALFLLVAVTAPVVAVLIRRAIDALPIKF